MTTKTKAREAFATYTWRDLFEPMNHHNAQLYDENPHTPTLLPADVLSHELTGPDTGGCILWSRTRDENSGHLMMFCGQSPEQEKATMSNASYWLSTGVARCERERPGWGWAVEPHEVFTDEDGEWWLWWLPNYRLST